MARWEEWLRRYAPAELLALIGAVAGYLLADLATHHAAAAAYGAAVGDNVAYYGLLTAREVIARSQVLSAVGALAIEFGPAEALDGVFIRPACTALGAAALGPVAGVLAAKVVADLVFYVPVITSYELRKRSAEAAPEVP
jgi:hypothetical protein